MKGILLISHFDLASGTLNAAKLIFGDQLSQIEAIGLSMQDNAENFTNRLKVALARLDTGDGVIILADLLGGTPCNCAAPLIGGKIRMLTGLNLPLLLEVLCERQTSDFENIGNLLDRVRRSIQEYSTNEPDTEYNEII
ncbi:MULTISPECIES: PTS sugar transporter subunit IIA [unclassified Clostridium]|uniref:PTS sugar transporter subunit IIA n=1 Tax=unclassified Clostridium TaxID=2614128 RepID=UPI00148604A7|nr:MULTISPECIES: PTS sugar transporter subunit IIA [unclassified Clostridium]